MGHILLADDDFEDRFMMLQVFKDLGRSNCISFVEDGSGVINFLEGSEEPTTLVVLDLNMPRVNGTEALKRIKSHPIFKEVPVIIFSTSVNEVEMQRALELGAKSYLTKPTTYSAYLDTCKLFIEYSEG